MSEKRLIDANALSERLIDLDDWCLAMTLTDYQHLAQRTSSTKAPSDKILNGIMGLCGETGEVADIVKKYYYQQHELDRQKLLEELGDVLWYCAELAEGLGEPLGRVAELNIDKLKQRYPEGFSGVRSREREK